MNTRRISLGNLISYQQTAQISSHINLFLVKNALHTWVPEYKTYSMFSRGRIHCHVADSHLDFKHYS